jgi:folate-binding protein YgfZ
MGVICDDTNGYNRGLMTSFPYATIMVGGADAQSFLQGQLTADIATLGSSAETVSLRSAWCNPKGRVICLLSVTATDGGFALTLPAELAEGTAQRLSMFRFRAKVDLEVTPASPETLGVGASVDRWLLEKLRAGVPEVWLAQSEKFTPHMLNQDLLGAVSFDKGCYTGQEVVARTHYRGATKRRCLRFESMQPVAPGDRVSEGDRPIGEVVNAIGNDLLAVVPVDKADSNLTVGGIALKHVTLPYLQAQHATP